uniref:Uncharacterized protein n=1 Tax=Tetranychus urticae TaxID=32264 RepID=T1K3D8_TETUR
MMARTKQTRRRAPSSSLVAASGSPLALREDVNFGNIDEENAAGLEATAEKQVSESALDEEDADDDEPESEGAEVSPEEWAKEPTEDELTKFTTMPVANYDFKCCCWIRLPAWAASCYEKFSIRIGALQYSKSTFASNRVHWANTQRFHARYI